MFTLETLKNVLYKFRTLFHSLNIIKHLLFSRLLGQEVFMDTVIQHSLPGVRRECGHTHKGRIAGQCG